MADNFKFFLDWFEKICHANHVNLDFSANNDLNVAICCRKFMFFILVS